MDIFSLGVSPPRRITTLISKAGRIQRLSSLLYLQNNSSQFTDIGDNLLMSLQGLNLQSLHNQIHNPSL